MPAWPEPDVLALVARALEEDIGEGDVTTAACVPAAAQAGGRFLARQDMVVAGLELLPLIYAREPVSRYASGSHVPAGEIIAAIQGPARLLLERERVALNFLQRLSGIATLTRRFVEAVAGTGAVILDTRKTMPGLRLLEKRAVAAGGGANHRFGLYDAVLIKENHIAAAGGVARAVRAVLAANTGRSVEVEVRNAGELEAALAAGARRVLLDNMTPAQVRQAVERARAFTNGTAAPPVLVEVSGGITLANVRGYAEAGPDFISVGALTHSAPAADISFLLETVV